MTVRSKESKQNKEIVMAMAMLKHRAELSLLNMDRRMMDEVR